MIYWFSCIDICCNNIEIHRILGRKYPNLVRDMEIRHEIYNQTLDDLKEMEARGEVYIIQPKEPITIKRTERDPDKLKSLYDIGRKEGMEHLIWSLCSFNNG